MPTIGGYGIPAKPTQPPNYFPTKFTEHTETTGGEEKSVYICEIRGRLFFARSFCVFCEFRGRTLRSLTICVHLCASVGGYSPPEASVNSVNSVGEYPPPEASVYSVNSVGGLAQTNLEWVLWKEFGGQRGYGSHKTIFPQNSRNTQKRLAEKKNLCTSVKSVGEYPPPEASVYSVQSVGEYPPPEASVYSVQSVGGLAQANLEWVLWKEFGGRRGYGRDAIPSYICAICGRISSA